MTHETLQSPETPSSRFLEFVESHADIVLEAADPYNRDVTRESTWEITEYAQLIPIDKVHFKVMIDLGPDRTMYHEIEFKRGEQRVFWLGYDSGNSTFAAAIGEDRNDIDISAREVDGILSELSVQQQTGRLQKLSPGS